MVLSLLLQGSYTSITKNGSLVAIYCDFTRPYHSNDDLGTVHCLSTHRQINILYTETAIHAILSTNLHAVHCQPTPKFVRREHIWVYYTAASDVITDLMRRQRQTKFRVGLFLMYPRSDLDTDHHTTQIVLQSASES